MQETAHFVFGIFGNASALLLFLAPMYGLPFVSKNNLLVSTINGTGAGIEFIYVLIFLVYAPKKEKTKILGLSAFVLTFFAVVALISLLALHGNTRKRFYGFATKATASIIMYASPLSIMRTVIRTKSVEFMPIFLSLFCFLCGTSWFIYGLLDNDPFVYVNHGFGSFLGAMQLILYFIYCKSKGKGKNENKSPSVASVELGLPDKPNTNGAQNGHV